MDLNAIMFQGTILLLFSWCTNAADSITQSQTISEGRTLVSADGSFELGFFSPGSSTNRYLGIWYKNIPVKTVVWVANRRNPIKDLSGVLMINNTSNLVLLSQNTTSIVWYANSTKQASNPIVQLLDSGNLVIRDGNDGNSGNYLWQSFDFPTDTLLSGMKLGWDLKSGLVRTLSAWKNWDDPSPGDFTCRMELHENPEAVMWKGSEEYYRSGPWNGLRFSGAPELRPNPVFKFNFVSNENEAYYEYHNLDKSVISRMVMNQTNYSRQRFIWIEADSTWSLYAYVPRDNCDSYNLCGPYGNCIIGGSPICQCLKGFQPKSQRTWNPMNWSQGCVRRTQLSCQGKDKDGFLKFGGLKLPDATNSWVSKNTSLEECRIKCLNNCSCMAYTNSDIRGGGSGCAIWYGNLIDIRQLSAGGQDLYVRMAASELGEAKDEQKTRVIVIVIVAVAAALIPGMLLIAYLICKSGKKFREKMENNMIIDRSIKRQRKDLELPFFDLSTIKKATDNFSSNNKLGEGGFGPVYKGTLIDGHEIAVKRLSQSSRQGLNEFINEVELIAKLQHQNLVRLLGCCIQGEETMLIYEYMANKSLDSFIFDQAKGKILPWSKRFHIINGIARGLLYLHEDSRLRIIHRDLKPSNVLLDSEMNPKISDFGLARIFERNQIEGNTNRVVGTYGYMAPEYAIDGLFSVKSDVFSFGILLLEIVSGKKNRGFYHPNHSLNLTGHAWKLWREGKPLELIDMCSDNSCTLPEMLRCIHVSLLCVQQLPKDRPNMSSVVMMLGSESLLPEPKEPSFLIGKNSLDVDSSLSKHQSSSTNEISITQLEAR
ncbi:G-type lectin S-receptor-like serine/threonine-protein kinase At4g27290 isoform X1 [Quercus robur]|uniref:G-type lectin S-receptor-like serine/threonine-protein kinase At4g27290 isoform X1 n=1 Tax=Quercus robur TaxID=38942 RepID=UPI0021636442|nr:G-type lectin S-receptor-like serine/threonine-protein kinase At4g27290 isoform X1 [Quercus robur]